MGATRLAQSMNATKVATSCYQDTKAPNTDCSDWITNSCMPVSKCMIRCFPDYTLHYRRTSAQIRSGLASVVVSSTYPPTLCRTLGYAESVQTGFITCLSELSRFSKHRYDMLIYSVHVMSRYTAPRICLASAVLQARVVDRSV